MMCSYLLLLLLYLFTNTIHISHGISFIFRQSQTRYICSPCFFFITRRKKRIFFNNFPHPEWKCEVLYKNTYNIIVDMCV